MHTLRRASLQLTRFADITTSSRHIFLSPHFDDIVYSSAAMLAVQASHGIRPLEITVYGGIPPYGLELSTLAFQTHRQMGMSNLDAATVVANRRKEDANALEFLHADYLWLDYLDAIYRGIPAYYTQQKQLFGGNVHP